MIGFAIGVVTSNAAEWLLHRYVLHGLGRRKKSLWSFHWHEHHRASRRNEFIDPDYQRSPLGWHAQGKEVYGLIGLCASVLPLAPLSPGYCAGVWASAAAYYHVHKKSHLDPEWARRWLPWHYDHHMGPDQDANWCVTFPLFDHILGTRKPYLGTEREARDRRRQAMRASRAEATVGVEEEHGGLANRA